MNHVLAIFIALIFFAWLLFEIQFKKREGNKLEIDQGNWNWNLADSQHYHLKGDLKAINHTKDLDIFLTEVRVEVILLSKLNLENTEQRIKLRSHHQADLVNYPPRADNYWEAHIIKGQQHTGLEIEIDLRSDNLADLRSAWLRIHYVVYGPGGRNSKVRHCILPLRFPDPNQAINWQPSDGGQVLPIPTHLLTVLDDPIAVIKQYILPHSQPGDIVTIGETPLAIMQGRYKHPSDIKPGWLAKRLCYYFLRTSSLATACGLQSLVDEVGAWRVGFAFIGGAIAKLILREPGMFYNLAGEQARLVDDVTGTLPPYDQFIVLGPINCQAIVDQIWQETGLKAAIVDVNDLRKVAILAKTTDTSTEVLTQALLRNPAGNAAEQTPLVLIRPVS